MPSKKPSSLQKLADASKEDIDPKKIADPKESNVKDRLHQVGVLGDQLKAILENKK